MGSNPGLLTIEMTQVGAEIWPPAGKKQTLQEHTDKSQQMVKLEEILIFKLFFKKMA